MSAQEFQENLMWNGIASGYELELFFTKHNSLRRRQQELDQLWEEREERHQFFTDQKDVVGWIKLLWLMSMKHSTIPRITCK